MATRVLLALSGLSLSAIAAAGCPLHPDRAPQPVLASAAPAQTEIRHSTLHRVETSMPVPVHVELEVRIIVSEVPEEERAGMVEAMNSVAEAIERGTIAEIKNKFGINATINATANVEARANPAEVDLRNQGFTKVETNSINYNGREIATAVWTRGKPRMEMRTVNAEALRSRAIVRIAARVCIDDREGLLGFVPTVTVNDFGVEALPGAQLAEADKQARHAEFLRSVETEAAALRTYLQQYRHQASSTERQRMRSKTGDTFAIEVPFQLFGQARNLGISVTALTTPTIDERSGD